LTDHRAFERGTVTDEKRPTLAASDSSVRPLP